MTEHTPTPWRVFTTPDGRKLIGIGDQDGQGILDCGFGVWSWHDAEGVANAELVVKCVNSHDALEAVRKAAYDYFMCAVQDEADDLECCVTENQHELAKALRDALRASAFVGREQQP